MSRSGAKGCAAAWLLAVGLLVGLGCDRATEWKEPATLPPPEQVVPPLTVTTEAMARERLTVQLAHIRRRLAGGGAPVMECREAELYAREIAEHGFGERERLRIEIEQLCGREVPLAVLSAVLIALEEEHAVPEEEGAINRKEAVCARAREATRTLREAHGSEPAVRALLERYDGLCP